MSAKIHTKKISEETLKRIKEEGEKLPWRGRCRICGEELEGLLSDLQRHICKTVPVK